MSTEHEHGTCHELLGQLSDYIDGDLEEALCAELEAHLAECTNCQVMVDTLQKTVTLYHTQECPDLPADVQTRLYKVLRLDA